MIAKQRLRARSRYRFGFPSDIKRKFKARAALMGMHPNELFVKVWQKYENAHPEG